MRYFAIILGLLLLAGFKDSQQVRKEFREPGHIPQNVKPRKYPKLRDMLSEKKKIKKKASFSFFNEASAACKTLPNPDPNPSPSPQPPGPEISPSPEVVPSPGPSSVVPKPSPSVSPSPGTSIDLRAFDSPIRDQFGYTCTAHAVISIAENNLNHSKKTLLSTRYLWSLYQQLNSLLALDAAYRNMQVNDQDWPQVSPSPAVSKEALTRKGVARLGGYVWLGNDHSKVKSELRAGRPVYTAMSVSSDMASCRATVRPTTRVTEGGHALEVVGMLPDPELGDIMILKNSWGVLCGDRGYQYMPFSLCNRGDFFCEFYAVKGAVF